ncbi:MAG: hypothetical protein CBB96_09470 [Gammaproteobacteria bacterium TMED36]|nr:MAG: hypothetical protein CBB96_09470 [Gammaproteobacteria bacterium TMED36]
MPMLQWTRGGFGDTSFDLVALPFNSSVMTEYAITFDETIIGNYTSISQQSDPTFTNVAQQSVPTFTAISQQNDPSKTDQSQQGSPTFTAVTVTAPTYQPTYI